MKYVIFNCDDLGISDNVNSAIMDCHINGIVSSASLMSNMSAAESACLLANKHRDLGVGVHLNLTQGTPVLQLGVLPDLITADGVFHPWWEQQKRLVLPSPRIFRQVFMEFDAQVTRCQEFGISPTHLDSHHHICKMPVAMWAMGEVARKHGITCVRTLRGCTGGSIKARAHRLVSGGLAQLGHRVNHQVLRYAFGLRMPNEMAARRQLSGAGSMSILDAYVALLRNVSNGVTEIVFHPGGPGAVGGDSEEMASRRIADLEVALSYCLRSAIAENGLKIVNFRFLAGKSETEIGR